MESLVLKEPPSLEILTERLRLRTLRVSDAERLMPILTSKDVMQWTTKPPVQDISQAELWISGRALGQDVFNFVIELRDLTSSTGEADTVDSKVDIIGVAGTFHLPKIGYLIHPSYWGKGIASEALAALVPAIFERFPATEQDYVQSDQTRRNYHLVPGVDYIEAWIDVENAASRRVLEKCGFKLCEEFDKPPDVEGGVKRVAAFRRAREGRSLEGMGLVGGQGEDEGRVVPPIE